MERNEEGKDQFFIVTNGKNRKGLTRGCIGSVDAETKSGELIVQVYGGSSGGNAASSATIKKEDIYPLTRHQAQLLLFVSPASRRLEVLCNVQLFSAICNLAQEDLVVVKYKKGYEPCLVKNLVQIGKKDSPGDLPMLGFELELMDPEKFSSKKAVPLPLFNASDIVQVAPGYHSNTRQPLRDNQYASSNRKGLSRINSMPALSSRNAQLGSKLSIRDVSAKQTLSHHRLEVGSVVEVMSGNGVIIYGVIRWLGIPEGKKSDWAGLELDNELTTNSDGKFGTKRYFTCKGNRALFVPLDRCKPDGRFLSNSHQNYTPNVPEPPPVIPVEELDEDIPPVPQSEVLSLLEGRMKGIQGHFNSCYLDATLFSLFSSSMTLDSVCHSSAHTEGSIANTLRRDIVNRLRRQGFVPAESVMTFRQQLGCKSFVTEEKDVLCSLQFELLCFHTDPEEFINVLLKDVLCMQPLLKLRSNGDTFQEAYTYQIILEKNQVGPSPSVQELLETSFQSCDLKFEEIPSCLMVQMPRFGKKFKMFPHIIPSTVLDITDLLHNSPRECFVCGQPAEYECAECLKDRKLQPGRIKQYCSTCNTQVHTHSTRQGHIPQMIAVSEQLQEQTPVLRHQMQLFAVLCINTSHYVSFVKYGPDPHSWLFFDSMADRCGDDNNGYNIPVIRACPEVGDFLSQPEEELAHVDLSQTSELVSRLLCDSYMCLYQSTANLPYR
ncbi:ubiquitin carboxyl-terminal hydrolase CYLD [Chanos chanos]|uniref:ubiquitinyl hydrolase 1 n=1 Tax=Chanos chanos TaxID=29144 RepID=A0A6J2VJC4_CHACN|nr:ubiquitin carboxyl-terminal hydrolase CYLD-like [Chanos chanos]